MSLLPEGPLQLVKYPDPRLRQVCGAVTDFDEDLRRLVTAMIDLMKHSNGVGLAGPQVGVMRRLFVCNPTGEPQDDLVVVNPTLESLTGSERAEEGCLSIPDVNVSVPRAVRLVLRAQDLQGAPFERPLEGLPARVCQHEYDHLEGRLILDYMDEAGRLANRRALKYLEDTARGP